MNEILSAPDERWDYVRLTDGGHFENLGLYELVRRRCKLIIVSDAGADPHWNFGDLAKAVELVRTDFGAEIIIDFESLKPGENRISPRPYVIGSITYTDQSKAMLIYFNTTLFQGLPPDVVGYAKDHATFPDESTADQFFDEEQFEAYRELGYRAGKSLISNEACNLKRHGLLREESLQNNRLSSSRSRKLPPPGCFK